MTTISNYSSFHSTHQLWILVTIVFFFIGIEYIYAQLKGKEIYRFKNSISNIGLGIFDRFVSIFMIGFIFTFYDFLQRNFALIHMSNKNPWVWVLTFIALDFCWYTYHRWGHKINILWAAHVVHHQSEDYNFATALTITPIQSIIRFTIWSVLPLMGFPVDVFFIMLSVNGVYQFFLHTQFVPKLGWYGYLFVTPSHHRVHHATNPQYIDKNFGAILIIWDRLFGTFEEEIEKPQYGITVSIDDRSFEGTVFHYYAELIHKMKQIPSIHQKIGLLIKSPDWAPKNTTLESLPLYKEKGSYSYVLNKNTQTYALFNLVLIIFVTLYFTFYQRLVNPLNGSILFGFILLSIMNISYRMEQKGKWKKIEILKWFLLIIFIIKNGIL